MPKQKRISIIGIGDDGLDGLSRSTRRIVEDAALVIGDERTLKLAPDIGAERFVVGRDLGAAVDRIAVASEASIAILVYGDPLFYGSARYLCDKLGKDSFEIVPHVSCMQLAFARLKESWDDAYLTDLANHQLDSVVDRIRTANKVGLFTTSETTPSVVAKAPPR